MGDEFTLHDGKQMSGMGSAQGSGAPNISPEEYRRLMEAQLSPEERELIKALDKLRFYQAVLPDVLSLVDRVQLWMKEEGKFYDEFKKYISDMKETIKMFFDDYNLVMRDYIRKVRKAKSELM